MDALTEIKQLYYQATKGTIQRDIKRAVELLKAMKTDEERERAAVFMDGLSQMRSEWGLAGKKKKVRNKKAEGKTRKVTGGGS